MIESYLYGMAPIIRSLFYSNHIFNHVWLDLKPDNPQDFSNNQQLNPNKDSKLLIASVIVAPSGHGGNIFDLIDAISEKITNNDSILKLKEITYQTIGPHLEESRKIRFDVSMAANTYKLFNHYDVPSISSLCIPGQTILSSSIFLSLSQTSSDR